MVIASWVWFLFLAAAAAAAAALLRKALMPTRRVWFDRFSGVILLGFAGFLAYEFWYALRS